MLRQIIRDFVPGCLRSNENVKRGPTLWVTVYGTQRQVKHVGLCIENRLQR